ncbi:hypothetical protein MYP_1821 [Sporocytophaga myxococcoides]|uniref:Uncharacterized protein n=1 Tax=Sporocytophaga myxococcoides TaxID=153721 RepID=A0A098LE83_9BACT|nr:hypothetical protein MYP_1821 [Sporocytophaga myxococcoides]
MLFILNCFQGKNLLKFRRSNQRALMLFHKNLASKSVDALIFVSRIFKKMDFYNCF